MPPDQEPLDQEPVSDQSPAPEALGPQGSELAPDQSPGRETSGAPQDQAPATIRDVIQRLGYSFGQDVGDDYTALAHLVNRAREAESLGAAQRQADIYTQLGRQLAPKAQEIGRYLQQQERPQPKAYEPPEFDERWLAMVERDPSSGLYVGKPGVPPEIVQRANAYAQWTGDFLRNPTKVIEAMWADRQQDLESRFDQRLQQALSQYQLHQSVSNIAHQNADWFYVKDPQGQFQTDPYTGQAVISPVGQQYLIHIRRLGAMGVSDPIARDQLARELLASQTPAAETPVQQQASTRQQQAMRQARGNRNPLQSLPADQRRARRDATEPDSAGLSMREMLQQEFEAAGVTDDAFRTEGAFGG